jgi:isopenicillin-N epimerase
MVPPVVSWGSTPGASFAERFRWPGTHDPAAFLAVPAAIDFLAEHGWDDVRARCHGLAGRARLELAELTGLPPLSPDESWLGQMVTTELPGCDHERLERRLYDEHRVEVPVQRFDGRPTLRAAFQGYNDESDLEALLEALGAEL